MTDDTLRAECEKLLNDLLPCIETAGGYYVEPTRAYNVLLAFARAQQAKGLEVAAVLCEREAIIDDERGYYGKEMARAIRAKIARAA